MEKRGVRPGRPLGATTFEEGLAKALGAAIRERRVQQGLAQEALATMAAVERSHMGKIERGEHLPSLSIVIRVAEALALRPGRLVDQALEGSQGKPSRSRA